MNSLPALCLFLTFLQFAVLPGFTLDESDYWSRDKEDCITELNLNRERIRAIDEQEIATEDDPEFNRFAQCCFLKSGIQDLNGEIRYDKIRELFESKISSQNYGDGELERLQMLKRVALDAVTWCENNLLSPADSPGQLAVRVGNCIMQYMKNVSE